MKTTTLIVIFFMSIGVFAQDVQLYETQNYRNAIENGTRSRDGKPGANYWQNHSDYDIEVRLDTAEKKIYGKETVIYYNESPDTLYRIVLRLYQNKYKKGAVRNAPIHEENISDGVILDTLNVNGRGIDLQGDSIRELGTNYSVLLETPLAPKSKIELNCSWSYSVPLAQDFRRAGYYKDKAWFIGYFYPQIAVYDDIESFWNIKGWDIMRFHKGWQEFYNDFNNFKVKVEVPKGFFVWATGSLVNQKDIFSQDILDRLDKARQSDENIQIISREDIGKGQLNGNVWEFEAKGVPDFGFGTAPNYIWEASSVVVGKRRVFVDVAYHPESITFPMVLDISKETVKYASAVYPAIEFPYSHATIFNGMLGGGMEFPMIANNAEYEDTTLLYMMTFHEIFHNYTPFMTGLNEKRYPFMDESFTQYFTEHYLLNVHQRNKFFGFGNIMEFFVQFAKNEDIPLINSYSQISDYNVLYYYYIKPNVAYKFFAEMVGENNFKMAFHEFVSRWKGKHPIPYDFFYTMNNVLNENYNWFWKAWFFDFGYPDLALELNANELIIKRVGVGSLPLPVKLKVENVDGSISTITKPMSVWKTGAKEISIKLKNRDEIKSISVDTKSIPDIDERNNKVQVNN